MTATFEELVKEYAACASKLRNGGPDDHVKGTWSQLLYTRKSARDFIKRSLGDEAGIAADAANPQQLQELTRKACIAMCSKRASSGRAEQLDALLTIDPLAANERAFSDAYFSFADFSASYYLSLIEREAAHAQAVAAYRKDAEHFIELEARLAAFDQ